MEISKNMLNKKVVFECEEKREKGHQEYCYAPMINATPRHIIVYYIFF